MTELGELFEEIAAAPAPPDGRPADELYEAGRRRYRRRMAVTGGALALGLAAVVGAAGVIAAGSYSSAPPPAATTVPAVGGDPRPGLASPLNEILWAGAADADHLYLSFLACAPSSSCAGDTFDLVASDDGGRTWTVRSGGVAIHDWVVLGPRTLVGASRPAGTPFSTLTVSVDGGRTWSAATQDPRPAPTVPAGEGVICWSSAVTSPSCELYAVDPAAGRFAAIAAQPPIALGPATVVLNVGGRLWVGGTDPVSGRPATAVSADAGRTWSVRVFTTVAGCSLGRCVAPELSTVDGRTAYAVVIDFQAGQRLVYRGVDSGGWEQVGAVSTGENQRPGSNGKTFITTDGTLVVCEIVLESHQPIGCRFWAARGGASAYQQVTLDGLPAAVNSIRRTPDGWFYANVSGDDLLYGSTDGWHWTPVTSK